MVFNFFLKPDLQEKGPIQEEFSDDALKGFEAYVSSVFLLINNFTEDDAKANLPNNGKHWLCGPAKVVDMPLQQTFRILCSS